MQENEGKLLFEVRADQSDIKKDIEAIKKQFESLTKKTQEEGEKQAQVWQNLIKGATAYFLSSTYKCNFLGADNKQ